MEKKELRKHLILYVSITLILITAAFSVSRAYFTMNISGTDTNDDVIINNANVELTLNSSARMNNTKLMLVKDTETGWRTTYASDAPTATFELTSGTSSTMDVSYSVYLTECKISSGFISEDFKWELVDVTTNTDVDNPTIIASGNFSNATSNTDTGITYKLTSDSITISKSTTHKFLLRVWLSYDESASQNSLLGQSFSAKVMIQTDEIHKTA